MESIKVLVSGKTFTIDKDDLSLFENTVWYLACSKYLAGSSGPSRHKLFHRLVLGYHGNLQVDHINRDPSDNRKCNLRLVTASQNQMNNGGKKYGSYSSSYRGVCLFARNKTNPWMAYININGKRMHLGYFKSEIEAAKAYDDKARELCMEFAVFNFPNDTI